MIAEGFMVVALQLHCVGNFSGWSCESMQCPIRNPKACPHHFFKGLDPMSDDPMVITMEVANGIMMKTLIDQESSNNILY